jgi:hypothetical protein
VLVDRVVAVACLSRLVTGGAAAGLKDLVVTGIGPDELDDVARPSALRDPVLVQGPEPGLGDIARHGRIVEHVVKSTCRWGSGDLRRDKRTRKCSS